MIDELLKEIMEKIEDGPDSHVGILARIANRVDIMELKKAIIELDKSMEAIRLIMKYLVFDLEATRRERDQLRTMLEDQK